MHVWDIIEERFAKLEKSMKLIEEQKKELGRTRYENIVALHYSFKCIASSVYKQIINEITTKETQDALLKCYQRVERVNVAFANIVEIV